MPIACLLSIIAGCVCPGLSLSSFSRSSSRMALVGVFLVKLLGGRSVSFFGNAVRIASSYQQQNRISLNTTPVAKTQRCSTKHIIHQRNASIRSSI